MQLFLSHSERVFTFWDEPTTWQCVVAVATMDEFGASLEWVVQSIVSNDAQAPEPDGSKHERDVFAILDRLIAIGASGRIDGDELARFERVVDQQPLEWVVAPNYPFRPGDAWASAGTGSVRTFQNIPAFVRLALGGPEFEVRLVNQRWRVFPKESDAALGAMDLRRAQGVLDMWLDDHQAFVKDAMRSIPPELRWWP